MPDQNTLTDKCYFCCGTGWTKPDGWDRCYVKLAPTFYSDPKAEECKGCGGTGQITVPFRPSRRDQTEPTPEMREALNELHAEARHAKMQKVLFATVQRAAEGHEAAIQALKSVGIASGVSAETVAAFQEAFKRCGEPKGNHND